MRLPECDVTTVVFCPICLLSYAYRPIMHIMDHTQVKLIYLKTFELELDFTEYNTVH